MNGRLATHEELKVMYRDRVIELQLYKKIAKSLIYMVDELNLSKCGENSKLRKKIREFKPLLEGEIQQALTELERLKKFKETFDNYELAKKQDFIAYENWQECEVELKKSIIKLEDLIETFDNYILQLNARIKINKEIIEENFDLNPSLCHDLEVENTALEFALMLLEGEKNE